MKSAFQKALALTDATNTTRTTRLQRQACGNTARLFYILKADSIRIEIHNRPPGLALTREKNIEEHHTSWNLRKVVIEELLMDEWHRRWDGPEKGRTTYGFIADVRFVFGVPEVSLSIRVCFLLTGHGSLGGFLTRRNLVADGGCLCRVPMETVMLVWGQTLLRSIKHCEYC